MHDLSGGNGEPSTCARDNYGFRNGRGRCSIRWSPLEIRAIRIVSTDQGRVWGRRTETTCPSGLRGFYTNHHGALGALDQRSRANPAGRELELVPANWTLDRDWVRAKFFDACIHVVFLPL